jgi:Raf kinase inhibitor-like YbhB/YbcL family protein
MKLRVLIVLCFGILLLVACAASSVEPTEAPPVEEAPEEPTEEPEPTTPPTATEVPPEPTEAPMPFELTSTAFTQGEPIPVKYSCDGEDISPTLAWGDPPEGTQSFVLIMDDPDAPGGTWDHWIVFNIPAEVRELPENMPAGMKFGDVAATFGKNSWGRSDYGGPCPPGGTHRYFFKLYALDKTLSLDESADKGQMLVAMEGHILAETELMGTFAR